MAKFILGYIDTNEDLIEFTSYQNADFESEEWCEVEAETLDDAKAKYEVCFNEWQTNQQ